ncbi:MAG: type II secretion system protein M [Betaproteobacteria bacterium]|nr:type II secretion system protein M [Betaproteobacteria bacterium]
MRDGSRWRDAAAGRWLAERSPREQALLGAAAAALLAAGLWWGVAQPLAADVARLRSAAPQARAALAEGQRMAAAIPALARTQRPAPDAPMRATIERALAATVGPIPGTQIDAQGERLRVSLPAVPFDALVALLESLQRDARLQLHEATLTARVDGGSVRAELLLGR